MGNADEHGAGREHPDESDYQGGSRDSLVAQSKGGPYEDNARKVGRVLKRADTSKLMSSPADVVGSTEITERLDPEDARERPIEGARVHLALPRQSAFIRDRRPPSR